MEWDKKLGFKTLEIEEGLYERDPSDQDYQSRAWMGLPFQTLQTPYSEILEALLKIQEQDISPKRIIDLGAAYGRIGVIVKLLFCDAEFLGLEMVKERVLEGKRVYKDLGLDPSWLQIEDILTKDFILPHGDVYFIYDFSDPVDLKAILDKLSETFFKEEFFLIAKGEAINSLIQHKYPQFYAAHGRCWLEQSVLYSSFQDVDGF